jgi:glycosyltransferase involved in cell wall biosynthesis
MRAERRAVRAAGVAITFSPRVARTVGVGELCPVTLPIPEHPVSLVADPVAVMLADWAWPPNQVALNRLLRSWPRVREQVPHARLLLAGRGMTSPPQVTGVVVVGEVATARDALSEAAIFAFPCPATSGPKMKVLDALAHGVPVVTTTAGVEGLTGVDDAVAVTTDADFAQAMTALLRDPDRRAEMAAGGRQAVLDHHSPDRAATARLALAERL